MRVVHILDHSLPVQSGYSYRTLGILREQGSMGWDTLQLTSPQQPDARASMEVVDGWQFFRTVVWPLPWTPRLVREYALIRATARRLDQLARQWRPDVLHAHSPVRNAWAALGIGQKLNIPVVYEIRALWEDAASSHGTMRNGTLGYTLARRLETHAVRRAHAVVTISRGLERDLLSRGVRKQDLFLVPNAVDVARFVPEESADTADEARTRGPVIGFIGSFYSYEGLDLLLEAAKHIAADRLGFRVLLVGGGPEERRLRELSASENMAAYVTFAGWLPHERIVEAYREIDIFVYPRRRNRLTELVTPLKPLEAMAMAKVVLASDVGGHRELIEDGRTGFLFRADDISALLARLNGLLEARHAWPGIGAAARRFVERERTWRAVAATYAQVYDRALLRSRRGEGRNQP